MTRFLFLSLLLLAILSIAGVTGTAVRQRHAVEVVHSAGGTVNYDWMLQPVDDADGSIKSHCIVIDPDAIGAPNWLRKLVGDDHFQHVVRITDLAENAVDEEVIAAIGNLRKVEHIVLIHVEEDDESLTSANIRNLRARIRQACDAEVYGP